MPNPPSSRGSRSSATKPPGLNERVGRRLPDEAEIASIHLVPGYLVRRLHVICQRIFSDAIGVSGMLPGHMGLLATLHTYPEIDQRTLGAIIGSDPVTTGQLLHLLERRGHVVRTVDPADRRARRLLLTPSGRALFLAMKPRANAALRQQIAPLPPEEREQFMHLLHKLVVAHLAAEEAKTAGKDARPVPGRPASTRSKARARSDEKGRSR